MANRRINVEYLDNHAERLKSISDLHEGELYVVGRDIDAFLAFRMPRKDQIDRKGYKEDDPNRSITINGIDRYEAILRGEGHELEEERVQENSSLHLDEFMDFKHMGVFRPTEKSRLRKTIEEGLVKDGPLMAKAREKRGKNTQNK